MAQSSFPITPVDVTPIVGDAWRDVDASAQGVPAGATGVIIHIENTGTTSVTYGIRKKGSTDNRITYDTRSWHSWAMIGVDANQYFQIYLESALLAFVNFYLVGYTTNGVTFFTNAHDKSIATLLAWTEIDCSVEAPDAIGLIFEIVNYYTAPFGGDSWGFRKKGSTDDRKNQGRRSYHRWVVIGCDASQKCQAYIEDLRQDCFLVGYITEGVTFNTNAIDITPTTDDAFHDIDLSALAPNAGMVIVEIGESYISLTTPPQFAIRKKDETGADKDVWLDALAHSWAVIDCGSNQLVEGKIAEHDSTTTFHLIGYAKGSTVLPSVSTDAATGVVQESAIPNGTLDNDGGEACACGFEWGETIAYGSTSPTESKVTGESFSQVIAGLNPGTTYHFRAFATNSAGTAYGADRTFTAQKIIIISKAYALSREEL